MRSSIYLRAIAPMDSPALAVVVSCILNAMLFHIRLYADVFCA